MRDVCTLMAAYSTRRHRSSTWHLVVAAVWLPWLLLAHAGLCPDVGFISKLPSQCQALTKVCVDQNVYVLYENQHNPRHELFTQLPQISLRNITNDYYGFGDVWGTQFSHPGPLVRPATAGEETRELAHPQFTRCTVPMVVYSNHLYMYGHFFSNTVTAIHVMQQNGMVDRRLSLVLDTCGMQLEPFHRFLLAPFTPYDVTTLSHLSSRLPLEKPETYNPDGQHGRCFWNLLACQFGGNNSKPTISTDSPLWSTGQAVLEHYRDKLPPIDPEFAEPSKLRVLIGVLPRRSKLRAIVNQDQVWSWCTKFKPPAGVQNWNGTACLLHEYGKDLLADLAYTSQADVLLGVHGESLFNAFFMRKHSSLIEIRPLNFTGHMPNQYMKDMSRDDDHSIFWWGVNVVNPAHSAPGVLELQRRGAAHTWSRERHTFVRLMALQYLLERIALTRDDRQRYMSFRDKHENYISDALEKLNDTQRHHLHRRLMAMQQEGGSSSSNNSSSSSSSSSSTSGAGAASAAVRMLSEQQQLGQIGRQHPQQQQQRHGWLALQFKEQPSRGGWRSYLWGLLNFGASGHTKQQVELRLEPD